MVREARALHFGLDPDGAAAAGGVQQDRAGCCFSATAVREEAQQLAGLVQSLMRLHTLTPAQPPPTAGAPDDQTIKRRRVAESDSDVTADDWPWNAPAESDGGGGEPLPRADCSTLCSSAYFAAQPGRLPRGGGGVVRQGIAEAAKEELVRSHNSPLLVMCGAVLTDCLWLQWAVSLLPSRYLLVHGAFSGAEDAEEVRFPVDLPLFQGRLKGGDSRVSEGSSIGVWKAGG